MSNLANEMDAIRQKLDKETGKIVSVALFGQPGAGKSSLINKIVGRKVAEAGVETDKTVVAAEYEHNGIKLVDLPGYGTTSFPKESYFEKLKIESFDLFLCVSSGKLHQADTEFFQALQKKNKVCIFVVNKHDDLWEEDVPLKELERRKVADICKHVGREVNVVFTSCKKETGLDLLMESILENLDAAKKERWARGAKAYGQKFLAEKKAACDRMVAYASAAAAANAINPIPGADIAVDFGILLGLFKQIRESYGLDDVRLEKLQQVAFPVIAQLANGVLKYSTKEGILILLKRYIGRQTTKQVTKYIPFVGQAIAAGLGYLITSNAGSSYLDDCHELAKQILDSGLVIKE